MFRKSLFIVGILVVAAIAYVWIAIRPGIYNGAGYAARMVCSCVHVSGRDKGACLADLDPQVQTLSYETISDPEGFKVGVPPLFLSRTVIHEEGFGCRLTD